MSDVPARRESLTSPGRRTSFAPRRESTASAPSCNKAPSWIEGSPNDYTTRLTSLSAVEPSRSTVLGHPDLTAMTLDERLTLVSKQQELSKLAEESSWAVEERAVLGEESSWERATFRHSLGRDSSRGADGWTLTSKSSLQLEQWGEDSTRWEIDLGADC
eukprot:941650-Prymnesium_polylepis.1